MLDVVSMYSISDVLLGSKLTSNLVSTLDFMVVAVGRRTTLVDIDSITWTDELVSIFKVEKVFEVVEVTFSGDFSPLDVKNVFSSFFEDFVTLISLFEDAIEDSRYGVV